MGPFKPELAVKLLRRQGPLGSNFERAAQPGPTGRSFCPTRNYGPVAGFERPEVCFDSGRHGSRSALSHRKQLDTVTRPRRWTRIMHLAITNRSGIMMERAPCHSASGSLQYRSSIDSLPHAPHT